jgi:hypothetical protein
MAKGKIDDVADLITEELKRYSYIVEEELEASKKFHADELRNELRTNSPENRPKYKKGWRVKADKKNKSYIVHNAQLGQLTHLLEKGHARRNGDRQPAQPHITPAEEKIEKRYLDDVERMIQQ